jgi:hypothetical protein
VLGGGISADGWVTILRYCLWLNEHTQYSNNGIIEKYKARLWLEDSPKKREKIMTRHLLQYLGILLLDLLFLLLLLWVGNFTRWM